jgi:endoglucanase
LIVGGVEYSRDLSWVLKSPLKDDNLVYASHIYPSHSESQWGNWFGEVAAQYPVMITEWGYLDAGTVIGPAYLVGSRQSYGEPLLSYLDELGSGWVACWYDDEWLPPMFTPGRESLTEYGQWVLGKLKQ